MNWENLPWDKRCKLERLIEKDEKVPSGFEVVFGLVVVVAVVVGFVLFVGRMAETYKKVQHMEKYLESRGYVPEGREGK